MSATALDRRLDGRTLRTGRELLGVFVRKTSVRIMMLAWVGVVTWRITLGAWSWWDAVPLAVVLMVEPFVEWVLHVAILHHRPRPVGRFTWDFHAAQKHRAHHRDPHDVHTAFVPLRDLVALMVGFAVAYILIAPALRYAVTCMIVGFAMLGAYEWLHFASHTAWRPKSRYVRRVQRLHRLHHFRNEHYWMGVTMHFADRMFRTLPEKNAVPLSPTARTLGGD
ncbi:MAG: sterol desaturase family protein [Acidimicrobiia bacterium]